MILSDRSVLILHALIHTEGQIIPVICILFHLLPLCIQILGITLLGRHKLFREQVNLIFVFHIKFIFQKTHLTIKSVIIQHLAVQFAGHKHFIKLPVLIIRRADLNLISTVRKTNPGKQTVDLSCMAVCCFDLSMNGRNDVVPKACIDLIALHPEFFLILWFIVPLTLFQDPVVGIIFLLHTGKSIGCIDPVEVHSGTGTVFLLFLLKFL